MSNGRIVVLGGGGGIGRVAVRALAVGASFDEVVVADVRIEQAEAVASRVATGAPTVGIGATAFDATDPASVERVITGAAVVLNCVGPFYRFGPPLLQAAIDAGVAYVDVCDDLDATVAMLGLDDAARRAGVCALIGMGNSPGLANVLVRYCADHLLDRVDRVDIMHIHGGEPDEGPAVIKHRIHAMTNDVPLFIDGEQRLVRMLEPSGEAFVEETDFRDVGVFPVYPYPHPETITLPQHLPGVRRVTNLGVVFPLEYFALTQDMVRVGACSTEPLRVGDHDVVPIEFAVAHIRRSRPGLLAAAGVGGPAGCLKIVVAGEQAGLMHSYVFSLSSRTAGAGEGTGIPAALGAVLVGTGEIGRPGVHPPEAVVDPDRMLVLAGEIVPKLDIGGEPGGGVPIHVEHRQPDGTVEELDLGL